MEKKYFAIVLVFILFVSLLLNIYNINFPLGYHFDETKKVIFIIQGMQDFAHPILMLDVVRALNAFLKFNDFDDVVLLGRATTAFFGALIVFIMYFISRLRLDRKQSLLIAFAVAVAPIMAIHSHYLKEDIIFTCFSLLSILFLIKLIRSGSLLYVLFLGFSTGLALSSKYIGIFLFLLYLFVPVFAEVPKRTYYKQIGFVIIFSLFIFVIINYPMLFDMSAFKEGLVSQIKHVTTGHDLSIHAFPQGFSYHLRKNIIPGISFLAAVFSLCFIAFSVVKWKKTKWEDRIFVVYVLMFYLLFELSPSKPDPDSMRYVVPIIPIMIYFAYNGIYKFASLVPKRFLGINKVLLPAFIAITLLTMLVQTIKLDYYLKRDTREEAHRFIEASGKNAKYEWLSHTSSDVKLLAHLDIEQARQEEITYLVASSFMYDRFMWGYKLENQPPEVYTAYEKYVELFKYPYQEFTPAYKSFAFSNPVIRIIDITKQE